MSIKEGFNLNSCHIQVLINVATAGVALALYHAYEQLSVKSIDLYLYH